MPLSQATTDELSAWQKAAIEVFCRPRPCGLHEAIARGTDLEGEAICALIRATVGCPLFRRLADEGESRD
jgi:hypothetical protein